MNTIPVPRFDTFYRYAELTALLQDYAAARPDLLQLRSLGQSHEGREIWLMVITHTATGRDEDKPAFWVDGNIHAGEVTDRPRREGRIPYPADHLFGRLCLRDGRLCRPCPA